MDDEFYGRGSTSNYSQHYAQARYLCYYLQEKSLLVNFYRDFTANAVSDPTGRKSLQKVFGSTDLKAFQKTW